MKINYNVPSLSVTSKEFKIHNKYDIVTLYQLGRMDNSKNNTYGKVGTTIKESIAKVVHMT